MSVRHHLIKFRAATLGLILLSNWGYAEGFPSAKDVQQVAFSEEWLRLVHYKKKLFGGFESEVDTEGFFLSESGKEDPEAELRATLDLFLNEKARISTVGQYKTTVGCAFPARFLYLKKKFGIPVKKATCKAYEKWKKTIEGEQVSLIFSSYYIAAPSSVFGHTFLRIDKKKNKSELLNYAVDFSARVPESENPIAYAMKGIFGSYSGYFSYWPYYIQVKRYNNSENRDLYEYPLNFTKEELKIFFAHLWELTQVSFDYYFFDENCSYQLLTLLEVVKPDWNLSNQFVYSAMPIDTLRAVISQPDAMKEKAIKFRPSLRKRLYARWKNVPKADRDTYFDLVSGKKSASEVDSLAVLDMVNAFYSFKKVEGEGVLNEKLAKQYRESLYRRSHFKQSRQEPTIVESRSDQGHETSRIGILGGTVSGSLSRHWYKELDFRPTLHGLLDSDLGYPRFSGLEVLRVRLRHYSGEKKVFLEEIKMLGLSSFNPVHSIETKRSYQMGLSYLSSGKLNLTLNCKNCHALRLHTDMGYAYSVFSEIGMIYLMGRGVLDTLSPGLSKGWRLGLAPVVGSIVEMSPRFKLVFEASSHFFLVPFASTDPSFSVGNSISLSSRFSAHFKATVAPRVADVSGGFNLYY